MEIVTAVTLAMALYKGLEWVGEKFADTLVEPVEEHWKERLQAPFKQAEAREKLQAAVRRALKRAGALDDKQDEEKSLVAYVQQTGLARLQAPGNAALRQQMALAVVGFTDPQGAPPEELRRALGWPRQRQGELSALLAALRAELAGLEGWKDLLAYANDMEKLNKDNLKVGYLQQLTSALVQTGEGPALRVTAAQNGPDIELQKKIDNLESQLASLPDELKEIRQTVEAKLAELRAEQQQALIIEKQVLGDEVGGDHVEGHKIAAHFVQVIHNYAERRHANAEELQRQVAEYLDWVIESFGVVELRGIEQAGRQLISLPLEQVYVPLQAQRLAHDEFQGDIEDGFPEVRSRTRLEMEKLSVDARSRQVKRSRPLKPEERLVGEKIALSQVLSLGKRVIVTGGPGCGKTTVLLHIAWTLAQAMRHEQPELAQEKLGLNDGLPLPIYVPLSLYANYLNNLPKDAKAEQKTLVFFICEYLLQRQTNVPFSPDFLTELLRRGQDILLLLDGLDEVPNEDQRGKVRQDIQDLCAGRKALRLVVTSRTAAYRGQAVLGRGFSQVEVLKLEQDEIANLVRQAYACIYPKSPGQAGERAADLLDGIRQLEANRQQRLGEGAERLVDSPLMVRLLLIVHFNERRLPDQRADLYRRAVDAILSPDYNPDQGVREEIEKRISGSLAANREMLQYLAFHMHQRGQEQGREIDEDGLCKALQAEPSYAAHLADLIAQTRQRGTLLEERSGLYRFIHLAFQEFLAARHLAEALRDLESIAAFLENGPLLDSWWREPVLLLAGYLDITSPALGRRLLLRLAGLDEGSGQRRLELDTELTAAELAAVAYLECPNQTADLAAPLQNRLRQLLDQDRKPYPTPLRRAAAADALDRMGWLPPNLQAFVRIQEKGLDFCIAKYPVVNAQYARFLEAEDFADPQLWQGFPRFDEKCRPMSEDWGDEGWRWLQGVLQNPDRAPDGKRVLPRYWDDPRFGVARKGAPVVGVTWYEASAYCRWLLRHWEELDEVQADPGWRPQAVRLPLETEWELAGGGAQPDGRYPWDAPGQVTFEIDEIARRANIDESNINRTTPVGMYPLGASYNYGLHDLAGNVWEWQANFGNKDHVFLGLRGGSWSDRRVSARVAYRLYNHPDFQWYSFGFRVVALPSAIL